MLSVPDPPRFAMTSAPLVQALVQINFPVVARLETLAGIAPLQARLANIFPYMNRSHVQQVSLMVGPAGPATAGSTESWVNEFSSDDGWTLLVTATSASLAVGAEYAGVEDFADRFAEVCAALADPVGVTRCDRLGVRYMDVVEIGSQADDWAESFRPEVVGIANPAIVPRERLIASITETRLQRAADGVFAWAANVPIQGIVRHGVVPGGAVVAGLPPRPIEQTSFLLDMDMFVASPQVFSVEAVNAQFRELHADIEKIFYWSLSDVGKERFGFTLEVGGRNGDR